MRTCKACGGRFTPKYDYHVLCWECWKASNDDRLRKEGFDVGYRSGYRDGLVDGKKLEGALSGGEPASNKLRALIPDLIRLVHPDAHPPERYDRANRVTAELMRLRDET